MSEYYNPQRTYGLFDPKAKAPYRISRSRLDSFLNCPRCFYLDRRLGVDRPSGFPFTLNSAVDTLLKKEFDLHRAKNEPHPMMRHYGIEAVPFQHEKINQWRNNRVGIEYFHQPSNFTVSGAIDDVWADKAGELMIVDYKSTSKSGEINLDADWQIGYKRQMEIYQWLFRRNNFKVSQTGYFVYANGRTDREAFDGKLEFDVKIIPYQGDDQWVERKLIEARECLMSDQMPLSSPDCDFCDYRQAVKKYEL